MLDVLSDESMRSGPNTSECISSISSYYIITSLQESILESWFDDPSKQHTTLTARKQHWPTWLLPVAPFFQWIAWRFLLPLVYSNVPWLLQTCNCTLLCLELKWRADKNATFSCRTGARHTQAGSGIITSRWYLSGHGSHAAHDYYLCNSHFSQCEIKIRNELDGWSVRYRTTSDFSTSPWPTHAPVRWGNRGSSSQVREC